MPNQLYINSVLGDLDLIDKTLNLSDFILDVYKIFEDDKTTPGIILLKENQFYALLSRVKFFEIMSKQFMFDVFSKRRIEHFFEDNNPKNFLILSFSTPIISAASEALIRNASNMLEPIIVSLGNNEYRILDFYKLLTAQNQIQLLMNDLLKQANDFKNEVLAIASHDLRNPIGVILGFSSLITNINNIENCKEFASQIYKSAKQMEELVNSFLISAINDSAEIDIELSDFDIIELIISIINSFKNQSENKNQKIKFQTMQYPVNVTSDRLKIKEVIENLLSNAIKYSEEKKEIVVSFQKNDIFFKIGVSDNGPGFSSADLKKVFGKFQRLSARPTGNETSTGLGLFISKKIVNKLNGTINIESEIGKGSTLTVTLPIKKENINNELAVK